MKKEALFNTLKAGLWNELSVQYSEYGELCDTDIDADNIGWLVAFGCKPYLFSTEDLVNEIEFNGEKFVPLIKLVDPEKTDWDKISIEEFVMFPKTLKQTWYKVEHSELGTVLSVNSNNLKMMPYSMVEKLISWHFNVFNLPEDQYIRVANENSPYR